MSKIKFTKIAQKFFRHRKQAKPTLKLVKIDKDFKIWHFLASEKKFLYFSFFVFRRRRRVKSFNELVWSAYRQ